MINDYLKLIRMPFSSFVQMLTAIRKEFRYQTELAIEMFGPKLTQNSLDKISEWSDKWQLQLAPEKCLVFSLVGCKRSLNLFDYHISGHELTRIDTIRDLGILMDISLRFDKHIDNIIKRPPQSPEWYFDLSQQKIKTFSKENIVLTWDPFSNTALRYGIPIKSILLTGLNVSRGDLPRPYPSHPYMERLRLLNLSTLAKRRLT